MVSTAAGAVGSLVGQLARRAGCRVVGVTGSAAKVARCGAEFGYHAAVDYSQGLSGAALGDLCPRGIDVFFDNTSGAIADAIWPLLNVRARVVQCGTAAIASWQPAPAGPRRDRDVLVKRIRHEGFVIFDHVARFDEVAAILAAEIRAGTLVYAEDIEQRPGAGTGRTGRDLPGREHRQEDHRAVTAAGTAASGALVRRTRAICRYSNAVTTLSTSDTCSAIRSPSRP